MSHGHEVLQRVREHEQKLWVPGRGDTTVGVAAIQHVLDEYDERLVLARHEYTGDWVVFIKINRDDLYPVLGLGPTLPSPEEVGRKLYESDAARHGTKLLDQVNRHNEEIRKRNRAAAIEKDGEVAEHLEWAYRREGLHPQTRIFVP